MGTYIIKKKIERPYTNLPNAMLKRPDMSMKAKGLLSYLLSLPDDWRIYKSELINHFSDKKDAIASAFEELTNLGYILKTELPREGGKFGNFVYEVGEEPLFQTQNTTEADKPQRINRDGETATENPPLIINNKQITSNYKEGEFDFSKKDQHYKIRERIRGSSIFEAVCMQNSIDRLFGSYLLDKFFLEQEINEEFASIETESRNHFSRWTRLHKNKYLADYRESLEVKSNDLKTVTKGGAIF